MARPQCHVPVAQGQATPSAAAGGALSASQQSERARTGKAVAVLHSTSRKWKRAFQNLKDDLSLRPIFHSLERRVEAHIFVSFLAYCLHVNLRACLRPLAPGLTPRSLLDKFAAIQMLNVHFPTTDGREAGLLPLHATRKVPAKCHWRNWAGNCRPNRRRASPRKGNCCPNKFGADLLKRCADLQRLTQSSPSSRESRVN